MAAIEITLVEIKDKLKTPVEVVPMVLHKLFQLPYDLPFPDSVSFVEQRQKSGQARLLERNADNITIGIELVPTVDKAAILTYIEKAAKAVIDLSVWQKEESGV